MQDVVMRFSKGHEWVLVEGEYARVGVTDFAQSELGCVVYVELPAVGSRVVQGQPVVVVESTKAASDLYAPVTGEVVEINELFLTDPEEFNIKNEVGRWLYQVKVELPEQLDRLLDREEYNKMLDGENN